MKFKTRFYPVCFSNGGHLVCSLTRRRCVAGNDFELLFSCTATPQIGLVLGSPPSYSNALIQLSFPGIEADIDFHVLYMDPSNAKVQVQTCVLFFSFTRLLDMAFEELHDTFGLTACACAWDCFCVSACSCRLGLA
jgi:hypothetical protein